MCSGVKKDFREGRKREAKGEKKIIYILKQIKYFKQNKLVGGL